MFGGYTYDGLRLKSSRLRLKSSRKEERILDELE